MSNFSKAFASARKAGKKTFTFGGKSYHTRLKGESKAPGKTPVPQSKPTGKVPVPSPKPTQTADLGKKTGKIPTPSSNPRKAPGVGIAKPGSAIAVAAQRRRERAVEAPKPKAPPKKTNDKGVPLTRTAQDYRGIVIKKKTASTAPTPDKKQAAQPKVPTPKMDPRKAPATGIAKKGSPLSILAQRMREVVAGKPKTKDKKTGGGGW
jgi:hypothetical protein